MTVNPVLKPTSPGKNLKTDICKDQADVVIMGYSADQNTGVPIKMSAPGVPECFPHLYFKSGIGNLLLVEIYPTSLHDVVTEKSTPFFVGMVCDT